MWSFILISRDIKTATILIYKEDYYKLCDFGSCSIIKVSSIKILIIKQENSRDTVIDDGKFRGTDVFIAPESGRGLQRGRSGIWSLGCCLFEMITGEIPWKEIKNHSTTKESVLFKITRSSSSPPISDRFWNAMSDELKDLFSKCFELVYSFTND